MILLADPYMKLMLYAVYCKPIRLVVGVTHMVPELNALTSTWQAFWASDCMVGVSDIGANG